MTSQILYLLIHVSEITVRDLTVIGFDKNMGIQFASVWVILEFSQAPISPLNVLANISVSFKNKCFRTFIDKKKILNIIIIIHIYLHLCLNNNIWYRTYHITKDGTLTPYLHTTTKQRSDWTYPTSRVDRGQHMTRPFPPSYCKIHHTTYETRHVYMSNIFSLHDRVYHVLDTLSTFWYHAGTRYDILGPIFQPRYHVLATLSALPGITYTQINMSQL